MADKTYQVLADSVVMTAAPDVAAEATTELLFGEQITVIEDGDDWVKGVCVTDGYEGYVPRGALDDEITDATHKVSAVRTFAFSEPDFKSPPLRILSFCSPLSIVMEDNGYCLLEQGGWVFQEHLTEIHDKSADFVQTALLFSETPYLWGGRTSLGLDCSALVQLSLLNSGHICPRDTKDQVKVLGRDVERKDVQRGDLVFFEGHVGIIIDEKRIVNATSRHMKTCVEDLALLESAYNGITAIRRIG